MRLSIFPAVFTWRRDMTDTSRIREILDETKQKLPAWVDALLLERQGRDARGDDALWVYVLYDAAKEAEEGVLRDARSVKSTLRAALEAAWVTEWTYIRFRAREEQGASNTENDEQREERR
jgi:hypothetical protein